MKGLCIASQQGRNGNCGQGIGQENRETCKQARGTQRDTQTRKEGKKKTKRGIEGEIQRELPAGSVEEKRREEKGIGSQSLEVVG